MQLKIHPVKFGDCFMLTSDNGESLLLDCGSDNRGPGKTPCRKFAFNAIASKVSSDMLKDALITHFDKDHFCGILEIPNGKINRVFLPLTILEQEELIALSMSRLLTIASPYSYGVKLSKLAVELFNKLPRLAQDIIFVKQGDQHNIFGAEIHIHWPKVDFQVKDQQMKAILDLGGEEGKDRLTEEVTDLTITHDVQEGRNTIFPQFVPIGENLALLNNEYNELCSAIANTPNLDVPNLQSRQATLESALSNCISGLQENTEGQTHNYENLERLLDDSKEIRSALQRRIPANTPLRKRINTYARAEYHTLIQSMNAISVVCSFDGSILFLGDVPANIIDHLVDSQELRDDYEIVKIQHHATSAYYTDKTPSARFGIISNGGYKRRKVAERFLTSRKYDNIVCTVDAFALCGDYCEYYSQTGAKHPSCNSVSQINNLAF